jgi:hypothetical protein
MRLAKEEKIVAVLLFMALGSLSVAFWAFSSEESSATGTGSSAFRSASGSAFSSSSPDGRADPGEAGRESVSLAGKITELKRTESGGHLLIRLNSTPLPVFVPANSGAEELAGLLTEGDLVQIKGILREYRGQEEIEVSRSADVGKVN